MIENCIQCGKCVRECSFLKTYGTPLDIKNSIKMGKLDITIAYECSLCGLCNYLCPENLNIKEYFLLLRQEAVNKKLAPLKQHKSIINFEKWMSSNLFKFYYFPENSDTLLFLGCAITGKSPQFIKKIIDEINNNLDKKVAVAIDCCFKISHDLGNTALFQKKMQEKINILKSKNISRIITICPSCYDVFKNYSDFKVELVYNFLNIKSNRKNEKFSVHDPCTLRKEKAIHEKIRELVGKTEKMKHEMEKTFCCGEGGAAGFVNRSYAKYWKKRRLNEVRNTIVVYCYGCKAFLRNRQFEVYHILDILFNDFSKISILKIWINRFRLKILLRNLK